MKWCIAESAEEAERLYLATGAQPDEPMTWTACPDDKSFTFNDGNTSITKTFGQWATERGAGYFCTANY